MGHSTKWFCPGGVGEPWTKSGQTDAATRKPKGTDEGILSLKLHLIFV